MIFTPNRSCSRASGSGSAGGGAKTASSGRRCGRRITRPSGNDRQKTPSGDRHERSAPAWFHATLLPHLRAPSGEACSAFTRVTAHRVASHPSRTVVRAAGRPRLPMGRPPVATRLHRRSIASTGLLPASTRHLSMRAYAFSCFSTLSVASAGEGPDVEPIAP